MAGIGHSEHRSTLTCPLIGLASRAVQDCDRQRLIGQTFHLQQHCAYILYHCANILATQGVQSHTTQTNQPSLRLGQVRHRGQTYLRYCGGESGPLRGVGPVMVWRILEAPCERQHMKLMAFGLCWNETSSIQEDGDWLRCGSTSLLIGNLTVVVTACDISLLSRPASTARVTANIYVIVRLKESCQASCKAV